MALISDEYIYSQIDPLFNITANGVTNPSLQDILEVISGLIETIYPDVDLGPSTFDGTFLHLLSTTELHLWGKFKDVTNLLNPYTSYGNNLISTASLVGVKAQAETKSTCDVVLIGQSQTIIQDGIVEDEFGNQWALPSIVEIPYSGEITVTATCLKSGQIFADINTINKIVTGTNGWQSVNNIVPSSIGKPRETEAEIRERTIKSVYANSVLTIESIKNSILSLDNVNRCEIEANDQSITVNSIPPNTIRAVVDGGDNNDIAKIIRDKKGIGTGTIGDQTVTIYDSYGQPTSISFYRPQLVDIYVKIEITKYPEKGFNDTVYTLIRNSLSSYINSLNIGEDIFYTNAIANSLSVGDLYEKSFQLKTLKIGRVSILEQDLSTNNVLITPVEMAKSIKDNIIITDVL